jgi:hypothetical protein
MNPQPGEIWLADLGLAAKTRPVVILSRQDPNPPRSLVLYVPSPRSEETVYMKCHYRGLHSWIVNPYRMSKDWDLYRLCVSNAGSAGFPER